MFARQGFAQGFPPCHRALKRNLHVGINKLDKQQKANKKFCL